MQHITKDTGVHLFTTNAIENCEIVDYLGVVTGCSIQGINFLKDYTAYLSDKFGGSVKGYEASLNSGIELALKDMAKKAAKLGANGIIGLDVDTGDVNNRMLMATCYGTAVRFRVKAKSNT